MPRSPARRPSAPRDLHRGRRSDRQSVRPDHHHHDRQSPLPSGTTSIDNSATVSAGTCSGAVREREPWRQAACVDSSASVTSAVRSVAPRSTWSHGQWLYVRCSRSRRRGPKLTYTIVVTNAGSASDLERSGAQHGGRPRDSFRPASTSTPRPPPVASCCTPAGPATGGREMSTTAASWPPVTA